MEAEDRIRRMGVRTGAAGSVPTEPHTDARAVVDELMDPERHLRIKKEEVRSAQ